MKSLYDVPAPAKLNLFLHIVGRRPDGYHLLESAFMLIDWCDTLHFELRADGQISREDLGQTLPADDLVLRAARALQAFSGTPLGAHIAIDKQIPSQAGMGGGSSDAASTLLALNQLWQLKLGLETLLPLGLTLGADVPFFLNGRNAWVSGIGEKISPIDLPPAQFLVVKPAQGLETQRIFSDPGLRRDTESAILAGFIADAYGFGRNDLQVLAERICPAVPQALALLKSVGLAGRMTGSGSAVFAKMANAVNVETVPGFQVRQCSNLQRHPLFGWAA
jgi:4-diphosphocytidyl-2-C-methyl-D-erythritol kinase